MSVISPLPEFLSIQPAGFTMRTNVRRQLRATNGCETCRWPLIHSAMTNMIAKAPSTPSRSTEP
jgi:hypothetical protein